MPRNHDHFTHPVSVLILVLAVLFMSSCSKRTETVESHDTAIFRTLDGQQLTLAQIDQPVLINFWSTSCAICIAEMPDLARLYEDYRETGFELIAVAMPHDPPNAVLEFAEARQLPFPVALDVDGSVLKAFSSVKGTPTSFLFNAQGELVSRHVGKMDWESLRDELYALTAKSS